MSDFLVLLIGLPLLWLWCRRDQGRARITEEQLERQTAETWRAIREDVDRLIELEIAALPPDEQQQWRRKVFEAKIAHLPPSEQAAWRAKFDALEADASGKP